MIQHFIDRFIEQRAVLVDKYRATRPSSYATIVKDVIALVTSKDIYDNYNPDPERIHQLNDGSYQGTLVFVIAAKNYQPSEYWYVKISYGSCSVCDTLESIHKYSGNLTDNKEVEGYLTLALHIVQSLKKMDDEYEETI